MEETNVTGIDEVYDADIAAIISGGTVDTDTATEQDTDTSGAGMEQTDNAEPPSGSDAAENAAETGEATADDAQADGAADTDTATEQDTDASGAGMEQADNAEPEAFLPVAFGEASGNIPQADAERIGASVGLTGAQLVQAIADGAQFQQYAAAIDTLEDYAAASGQDIHAFVDTLQNQLFETKKSVILSELREKYADSDPALLDKLADDSAKQQIEAARSARTDRIQSAQEDMQGKQFDRAVARWSEVGRLFPDIKTREDVPENVYKACNAGADPVEAMYKFQLDAANQQITELQRQLEITKRNASNHAQAPGSMSGADAANSHEDDIRTILLS